jgi:thiamine biosynthesis lipoprotein
LNSLASESFPALGTRASVFVTVTSGIGEARAILVEELEAIDLACSRFREDSDLMAVNRSGGRATPVSALFLAALRTSLDVAEATDGAVDPTVGLALKTIGYDRDFAAVRDSAEPRPRLRATPVAGWRSVKLDRNRSTVQVPADVELDLGATAKALCADRAAIAIHRAIGGGVMVNLGGDLATEGEPPAGGWLVRVTDDHAGSAVAPGQTVGLLGGALATSSTTVRRWRDGSEEAHHIVDPKTGRPAKEVWRTVSVAADSCVDANAASTAAIVRGEGATQWLEERALPSRLVSPSGAVTLLRDWPQADVP